MHLRVVAGACALSTGLLIGSPVVAIAVAAPGSDGASTPGDSADGGAAPARPARGPIGGIADSLRKAMEDTTLNAVQGVTSTVNSVARSGRQQLSNITPPPMKVGGTPTAHGSTGSSSPATEPASKPATEPAAEESGAEPVAPLTASPPIAPTAPAASLPESAPAAPDLVTPVADVIAAVVQSAASAPALVAALPTAVNPVADVLASLQGLLTSVGDAGAPLAQFPTDLAALLGVGATVPGTTVGGGIGSSVDVGPLTPASMPGPFGRLPVLPGFEIAPMPDVLGGGTATPYDVSTSGTSTGVASPSTMLAPAGDASSALSVVQKVIGAVVATVSLAALAAMALPGLLGLLGTWAAGIRIGYRQAKAGSELPATAIARFVGSGPVGVVRSSSQISLRPRVVRARSTARHAARIERPVTSSPVQLLDRVG